MEGGILGLALALLAQVGVAPKTVDLNSHVTLHERVLRVGDLVNAERARLPARLAELVIARLPDDRGTFRMPGETAAALVRRRVPALHPISAPGTAVQIDLPAPPARVTLVGRCFAAGAPLTAGSALTRADITETACQPVRPARLRYAAAGIVFAAESIESGAYLGRLPRLPEAAIGKGAALTLRSSAGPVTIERPVIALQAAQSGGRLFVRSTEGDVFAAPLGLAGQGRP